MKEVKSMLSDSFKTFPICAFHRHVMLCELVFVHISELRFTGHYVSYPIENLNLESLC